VAPPPKPRKPKTTEVVVDEANNDGDVKVHSQSPHPRGASANADISAVAGLATKTTGSSAIPVLNTSNPFDIVASIKETMIKAADRKKAAATKPGSAFGSRIVPDTIKKYELPAKAKPKV